MAFAADIREAIASGRLTPPSSARGLAFSLFFLSAALLARPSAAAPGQWEFTGSLNTGRVFHTATLLPNGKVLVAGGSDGSVELATAELYDPAIGTWSTTGSMNVARQWHSATLLPNGLVLVAGGLGADEKPSAELYDPGSGTWSFTGSPTSTRAISALLFSGKVLVVDGDLKTAELYDPTTGTWSLTGRLNERHINGLKQCR